MWCDDDWIYVLEIKNRALVLRHTERETLKVLATVFIKQSHCLNDDTNNTLQMEELWSSSLKLFSLLFCHFYDIFSFALLVYYCCSEFGKCVYLQFGGHAYSRWQHHYIEILLFFFSTSKVVSRLDDQFWNGSQIQLIVELWNYENSMKEPKSEYKLIWYPEKEKKMLTKILMPK